MRNMKKFKVEVHLNSIAKVIFDVEAENASNAELAVRNELVNPESTGVQIIVRSEDDIMLLANR